MRSIRHTAAALFAAVGLLTGTAFTAPVAQATTGPSANMPKTFKVKSQFAGQFVGQYILKSVPAASRIKSAALGIEVNNRGFLYGIGQFYGYDESGNQISWIATLYHFRQVGKTNEMKFDLLSSSLTIVLGRMSATPPKKSTLKGSIVLNGHTYPIAFHQVSTR